MRGKRRRRLTSCFVGFCTGKKKTEMTIFFHISMCVPVCVCYYFYLFVYNPSHVKTLKIYLWSLMTNWALLCVFVCVSVAQLYFSLLCFVCDIMWSFVWWGINCQATPCSESLIRICRSDEGNHLFVARNGCFLSEAS